MSFSSKVREKALLASKRHCVWCEKVQGITVECHHIVPKAEGGDNTFENCIPVCLNCHGILGSYNSKHPKGTKISSSEMIRRRDDFYERVKRNEFPLQDTQFSSKKLLTDYDVRTYEEIVAVFNDSNLEYYLTEYDLGNDFNNEVFIPLSKFYKNAGNPVTMFIDEDLEYLRQTLITDTKNFLLYKASYTYRTSYGTQALNCWKNYDYSDEESASMNREFNDLATSVWDSYCDLIKRFKRKLA